MIKILLHLNIGGLYYHFEKPCLDLSQADYEMGGLKTEFKDRSNVHLEIVEETTTVKRLR